MQPVHRLTYTSFDPNNTRPINKSAIKTESLCGKLLISNGSKMLIRSTKVKAWKKQDLLCSFQLVQLSECPQFVTSPYSMWPKRKRNEMRDV